MTVWDFLGSDTPFAIAEGVVHRGATSVSDTIDVSTAADFGAILTQVRWGPERAGRLPTIGDPVLIVWPVAGDPWVVGWWPYA